MLILALDTSSPVGSVAILENQKLKGIISTSSDENFSSRIFRQLEFLLGELRVGLADFDVFAVASGPGSFTGLRVGLTAAKGWAELYGKRVAAVGTLEAIAIQSHAGDREIAAAIDAHRGQVYGALFERAESLPSTEISRIGDELVMRPEEFLSHVTKDIGSRTIALATPTPIALVGALAKHKEPRIVLEPVSTVLAPFVGLLGYQRAERGQLLDPLALDANYVRRSDAELNWKNT